MIEQNVKAKVLEIIQDMSGAKDEQMKDEVVLEGATHEGGLGMDDLDSVELIMDLEVAFKIQITDEDAHKWKTVKDVVDYVLGKV